MSPLINLPKMSLFFTSVNIRALCIRLRVGRHINVLCHLSQNRQWGWKIFTYDYQELFETSWKYWYELGLKCLIGHHVLSISIEFLHFHVRDFSLFYISQVHLIFPSECCNCFRSNYKIKVNINISSSRSFATINNENQIWTMKLIIQAKLHMLILNRPCSCP